MQPTRPESYGAGASAETVGARHICMSVLPMEDKSYMLEGECVVGFGDRMQHAVLVRQGDHAFVPADLPHAPCNETGAPCTWLVVHSSGSDQDGTVLLPELDALPAAR